MRRSAATVVALLVALVATLAATLVAPAVAGAQTSPAAPDPDPTSTTSTTVAPGDPTTTTVPAPTNVTPVDPASSTDGAAAPDAQAVEPTLPPAVAAAAQARATRPRGPRNLSEATYVYTAREVKQAWNNSHVKKITLAEARTLARYLNAVVANQIRQYLLAVYLNAVNAAVPNQANWDRVAQCESGGNWHLSTGNGFYGGLQFSLSTWRSVGGTGYPHQHSRIEQIRRANLLKDRAGLGQWPHCGSRFYG
ncbi:MAG: transglycosylase family protein [Acidimicrobiales bacterium]|nr:transglycosylase family protein [Acidimicrobiales bacterium]